MSYETPPCNSPFQNPIENDDPENEHVRKNYAALRQKGLWENEDSPDTPYCDDVTNKFYGGKGKK